MSGRSVVLIGPMGAGKTSIGRKAAKLLGVPFTDTDAEVARVHGAIPEIFRLHGEAVFRAYERDAVRQALAGSGIVALGGGAVLHADTQADLAAHGVILLTVSRRIVASRIRGTARPLLSGEDPMVAWDGVAAERSALYARLADATFDTSTGRIGDIAAAVAAWVRDRGVTGAAPQDPTTKENA